MATKTVGIGVCCELIRCQRRLMVEPLEEQEVWHETAQGSFMKIGWKGGELSIVSNKTASNQYQKQQTATLSKEMCC